MAEVVILGRGPVSFDNKSIDRVIGQEVAESEAEVEFLGLRGPSLPKAREPQVTFTVTPIEEGQDVGPSFDRAPPDVVLGPVGQSTPELDLASVFGEFLYPASTFTSVEFEEEGPLPPLSLSPESSEPFAGTYRSTAAQVMITDATNAAPIVITTATPHGLQTGQTVTISGVTGNTAANGTFTVTVIDDTSFSLDGSIGNGAYVAGGVLDVQALLAFPAGTLAQLNVTFPNQFPAVDGPVKGMRITFLDREPVNPVLRGLSFNMVDATFGEVTDTISVDPPIPIIPGLTDFFDMIGKIVTRVTPNIEVILG